ncbi:MAG: ABC transporter permease, partial [Desulfobacterales bacterium]
MPAPAELRFQKTAGDTLTVDLAGSWKLGQVLPSADEVRQNIEGLPDVGTIAFDTRKLADWDSGLLIFLKQLSVFCAQKKITIKENGLPEGARKLLALAAAVPANKDARKAEGKVSFLTHVGNETVDFFRAAGEMLTFIGDTVVAFGNLLRGRARYRRSDLWLILEDCGGGALPIVSLICFLVGLILAFIGAIQLQLFGAQIYVANLVGIAMVRLMAAIMTGIVMAGRTGGAFAAQLGTMQVNQEIDALRTLGISPMEFLVLPRLLALALMMPLLCLYANVMGIL